MPSLKTHKTEPAELSWLCNVRESVQPVTERSPVWVRHGIVRSGPAVPHPERHPYCEFGVITSGAGVEFVEREDAARSAGDIFLCGPGVPHWFEVTSYPIQFITVYFLPSLLIDMGPESDGVALLHRISASQSLRRRLFRPPPPLRAFLSRGFKEMVAEFDGKQFGREVRLRCVLLEMLVKLLRSERRISEEEGPLHSAVEWERVNRVLRHLQAHFAEPLYSRDVAAVANVSESKLKAIFRQTLGMTWVHYLQSYRIHRAVALLGDPGRSVTEVALGVGFESLSHFHATFRAFMGVSPSRYLQRSAGATAAGKGAVATPSAGPRRRR